MNTNHMNNLFNCALIITLLSESGEKTLLQLKDKPKSSDGLQLHIAEIPAEERLIWQTGYCNSGVQPFSQTKADKFELAYCPSDLLVRAKILTESPSQIFSPAPRFTVLLSAA